MRKQRKQSTEVSFTVTKADRELIHRIAERAWKLGVGTEEHGKVGLIMDVTACHANGCPLALDRLLAANGLNFLHDVAGIYRHMDRTTGQLTDCFVPRFADLKVRSAA